MRHFSASLALVLVMLPRLAGAQTIAHRGFVDAALTDFPQDAPNDHGNAIGLRALASRQYSSASVEVSYSTWLNIWSER